MARGVGSLILTIGLAVSLAAGPSYGQPKPPAPAKDKTESWKPPLPPAPGPLRPPPPVFCNAAEKAAALAQLEAALAEAEAAVQKLGAVEQMSDIPFQEWRRVDAIKARPGEIKAQIADVKARGITDCSKLKNVLPKAPLLKPVPWSKGDKFCSQAALDAYRRDIRAALDAARANRAAVTVHMDTLQTLLHMAREPNSPLAPLKDGIDQAVFDYLRVVFQVGREYEDLETEYFRAAGLKVVDCGEHQTTPQGDTGPGGPAKPQAGGTSQPSSNPQAPQGETPPPKGNTPAPEDKIQPPELPPQKPERSSAPGCDPALLAVLNQARADPAGFADGLATYRGYFHGVYVSEPGRPMAATIEGVVAVDDAIADLRKRAAVGPLALDVRLDDASSRLAEDLGPKGGVGHTGSDGSTLRTRMQDAGVYASVMEEDVSLAQVTALGIVRQLIIDDGVPTRGHRDVVFNPDLKLVGFGGAPHKTFGSICVVDFAGGFMSAPPPPPPPPP